MVKHRAALFDDALSMNVLTLVHKFLLVYLFYNVMNLFCFYNKSHANITVPQKVSQR